MISVLELRLGVSSAWGYSMWDHLDDTVARWDSGRGWVDHLVHGQLYYKHWWYFDYGNHT